LEYDWVVSLDDDYPSCALASELQTQRLSGGYKVDGELAYTRDLEPWFGMGLLRPQHEGGLAQANALKRANQRTHGEILYECLGLPLPVPRPTVTISPKAREQAISWLVEKRLRHPIVALNTGAAARWQRKSWSEGQTAQLAQAIYEQRRASVVIVGGVAEAERNLRIEALASRPAVVAAPAALDLIAFAALLEQCDLVVSSDSLAVHLSNALAKRMVVFFGPTSASEIDLYGLGEKIVTSLECRGCYLKTCDAHPNCMDSIAVNQVLSSVGKSLDSMSVEHPFLKDQPLYGRLASQRRLLRESHLREGPSAASKSLGRRG
jgi:heptosyltransferase-2